MKHSVPTCGHILFPRMTRTWYM